MIEPGLTWALGYLAVVLAARGDAGALEEAMQLCERARTAAVGKDVDIRAHVTAALGIVLLRSGDAVAARAKLAEAQGLDVDLPYLTDLSILLEQRPCESESRNRAVRAESCEL